MFTSLRTGKRQRETHRAAHVSQSLLRSLHSALSHADGKRSDDVAAELHRDTTALQRRRGEQLSNTQYVDTKQFPSANLKNYL